MEKRGVRQYFFLLLILIVIVALMPTKALADTCNGVFEISYSSGPEYALPEDVYQVKINIGAGLVQGGTKLTLYKIRFALDCADGSNGLNDCIDLGEVIEYLGDSFLSHDCPLTEFSSERDGNNVIVFIPDPPLEIPAGEREYCSISFLVKVLRTDLFTNIKPKGRAIEEHTGFIQGYPPDGQCDNDLVAGNQVSGAIYVCPQCDDGLCCNGLDMCNQDTGECIPDLQNPPPDCRENESNYCVTYSCKDDDTYPDCCHVDEVICPPKPCHETIMNPENPECCEYIPLCIDDGKCCNGLEYCDPNQGENGECVSSPSPDCDDGDYCTVDKCHDELQYPDCCENILINCPPKPCFTVTMDSNDPNCCVYTPIECPPSCLEGDQGVCDPATGECVYKPIDCDDDDECTIDTLDKNGIYPDCCYHDPIECPPSCLEGDQGKCDPNTGQCVYVPIDCDDGDPSTRDIWIPDGDYPECCEHERITNEICRTPGFWGTHAGTEKAKSQNITQALIDHAGGCLEICGEFINNTDVGNDESALEAICTHPRGDSRIQLVRQLTALALNCIMSNGNRDCTGTSVEDLFAECNTLCATGIPTGLTVNGCIEAIDCFNNGGTWHMATSSCQTTGCSHDLDIPCNYYTDCAYMDANDNIFYSECIPLPGNCHSRQLCNDDLGLCFEPPGPAGSPKDCNNATKSDCTVIPPKNASCVDSNDCD